MKEQIRARVEGLVQGVGFRAWARHQAASLGLTGFVWNRRDGSVELVAEGDNSSLNQFLELLRAGPSGAEVEAVHIDRQPASGLTGGFTIEPTR